MQQTSEANERDRNTKTDYPSRPPPQSAHPQQKHGAPNINITLPGPHNEMQIVGFTSVTVAAAAASGTHNSDLHVDNCASISVVGDSLRLGLRDFRPAKHGDVVMMNNFPAAVKGYGDLHVHVLCARKNVSRQLVLREVAYVPTSRFNLLSWSRYAEQLDADTGRGNTMKSRQKWLVLPLDGGSAVANMHNGLYSFKCRVQPAAAGGVSAPPTTQVTQGGERTRSKQQAPAPTQTTANANRYREKTQKVRGGADGRHRAPAPAQKTGEANVRWGKSQTVAHGAEKKGGPAPGKPTHGDDSDQEKHSVVHGNAMASLAGGNVTTETPPLGGRPMRSHELLVSEEHKGSHPAGHTATALDAEDEVKELQSKSAPHSEENTAGEKQPETKQQAESPHAEKERDAKYGAYVVAKARETVKRLHRNFGHAMSLDKIKMLLRNKAIRVSNKDVKQAILDFAAEDCACLACAEAATNKVHPSKTASAQADGQWTFDFSTGFPTSRQGNTHVSVWVGPKRKGVWLGFHKAKSEEELLNLLKQKWRLWQNEAKEPFTSLRSDRDSALNGGEVSKWLEEKGVSRSQTTGASGGPAEGYIRVLTERARANLNDAALPSKLWQEAFVNAQQGVDIVPDRSGMSSYERRRNQQPPYKKYLPFGTRVTVHIPKAQRGKFRNKGRIGRVMHRLEDGDGWKVYMPKTNTMVHTNALKPVPDHEQSDNSIMWTATLKAEVRPERREGGVEPERTYGHSAVSESEQRRAPASAQPGREVKQEEKEIELSEEEETSESEDSSESDAEEEAERDESMLPAPLPPRVRSKPAEMYDPEALAAEKQYAKEQKQRAQSSAQTTQGMSYLDAARKAESLLSGKIPRNPEEAVASEDGFRWVAAMKEEEESHEKAKLAVKLKRGTIAPGRRLAGGMRIKGRPVVEYKWVFDIKLLDNDDETVGPTYTTNKKGQKVRYKARKVAKGFTQRQGDFGETYAPTPQVASVRMAIALSLLLGWQALQMDVKSAFLQADLPEQERVWLLPPKEDKLNAEYIFFLMKSLYGLRQAAFRWNEDINKTLREEDFEALDADTCIYTHRDANGTILCILVLHVDDMLVIAPDGTREDISARLQGKYTMTESPARWFLKMNIAYASDMRSVTLSAPAYADAIVEAAERMGLSEKEQPVSTPASGLLGSGSKEHMSEEEKAFMQSVDYGELVGMLAHYSIMTRPDLAQAVGQLQRFCRDPRKRHWYAALRVVKYIKGTKNYGLCYTKDGLEKVIGYADSDWASDEEDRKSTTGWVFIYMGAAICWKSKKQPGRAARSTAEAELIALDQAVREALWLRKMCKGLDIGVSPDGKAPTIIVYEDNEACLNIANGSQWSQETKHVQVKHFAVREDVRDKRVEIRRVDTSENIADMFTKALGRVKFQKFRKMMGVVPVGEFA